MDAPAVAAAAVAVAVLHAQAAAIEQLLRERERAAMANEDARSYIAQRHFVGSVQVPRHGHVHVGTHQALCNHPLRRFPQILTIDLLKHSSRPLQILKNIFQKIDLPSVLLLTMTGFSVTRWTDYCLIFGNFRR